jgi:hypothetical protein
MFRFSFFMVGEKDKMLGTEYVDICSCPAAFFNCSRNVAIGGSTAGGGIYVTGVQYCRMQLQGCRLCDRGVASVSWSSIFKFSFFPEFLSQGSRVPTSTYTNGDHVFNDLLFDHNYVFTMAAVICFFYQNNTLSS